MECAAYVEMQNQAIIDQFKHGQILMAMSKKKIYAYGTNNCLSVIPLVRTRNENALVLTFQDTKDHTRPAELWVRHRYSGYRLAFGKFLVEYEGFTTTKIHKKWAVDHLCSRILFQNLDDSAEYYIRLVLLDARLNAAFGSGMERLLNVPESQREIRSGYGVDWLTILKIFGYELPGKRSGTDVWIQWTKETASRLAAEQVADYGSICQGLSTMLNLAYTNDWSPIEGMELER